MMFINRRFPDHIAEHAVGGPSYITSVVTPSSRIESRDQTSGIGLGRWTVSQNAKLKNVYKELLSFFRVARGRQNTFPFKDWNDFQATATEGVLIATGVANRYQLYKRYSVDPAVVESPTDVFQEDRKIRLPVRNITINGGSGVSVDYETGLVTSTTPPNYWTGEFDCLCRFDTDQMEAEIVAVRKGGGQFITSWGPVPIVEVAE